MVTDYVAVPCELVDLNKVITLAADMVFVDGTSYLFLVSRKIKFATVEHVPVRMVLSLSKHLKRVVDVYGRTGFRIQLF